MYDWGFKRSKHTNDHAGLRLLVKRPLFDKRFVKRICVPPPDLGITGRAGGIRFLRRGTLDLAPFLAYISPDDHEGTKVVYKWLREEILDLPASTIPRLGIDANGELGIIPADLDHTRIRTYVGPINAQPENANGTALRQFASGTELYLANTYDTKG